MMFIRIYFFLSFLLFAQNKINAQQTGEWQQYLNSHLKTNVPKKNGAPPGVYTVTVSFMLDSTGKIYDIRIEKDPGYGTAKEVIRVLENVPQWPPEIVEESKKFRQQQNISFKVK